MISKLAYAVTRTELLKVPNSRYRIRTLLVGLHYFELNLVC